MKVRNVSRTTGEPMYFKGNQSIVKGKEALARLLEGYLLINLGEIWTHKTTGINWLSVLRDGEPDGIIFAIRNSLNKFSRNPVNRNWGITGVDVSIKSLDAINRSMVASVKVNSIILGEVTLNVGK